MSFINEQNFIIFKCFKCDSIFKNKHTLELHEITSESCSEVTENTNKNDKICFYCKKSLSSNQMKRYPESKCIYAKLYEQKSDYENKIKELTLYYENEMQKLKSQLVI